MESKNNRAGITPLRQDPFASPQDDDVCLKHHTATPVMGTPMQVVNSGLVLERPQDSSEGLERSLPSRVSGCCQDNDMACSEWETVAADDEFETTVAPQQTQKGNRKNFQLLFQSQEMKKPLGSTSPMTQRRNTVFLLPNSVQPRFSHDSTYHHQERALSAYSSPSFYTDRKEEDWVEATNSTCPEHCGVAHEAAQRRRATLGLDRNSLGDLVTRYSPTSSSMSSDPFRYDGNNYSTFLQSKAQKGHNAGPYPIGTNSDSNALIMPTPASGTQHDAPGISNPFHQASFYNQSALQSA